MANQNRPSGFTPVKYLNGADWTGQANVYSIDSGDGSVYWPGDPVKLSGSGDTNGIPGVVLATAGATFVGVLIAVGVNPGGPYIDPDNLTLINAPATKAKNYYALVVDDPNVIFEGQEAGAGAALTVGAIGENIDFVTAAPATGVRVSGSYLDNNNHNTTSTRNFKILGLVQRVDNALGLYAKWWVLPNNHSYRAGVTGV